MTFLFLIIGLIGSSIIAASGYYFSAISRSGIIATIFIGTTIAVAGDFSTWSAVIFLFGSSLIINFSKKLFFPEISSIEQSIHSKNGARDASQICANLLPAVICLLIYFFTSNTAFLIAYLASIAGATADTWASEIGILSNKATIDVLTLRKTPKGLSGGISLLGTIASIGGSFLSTTCFFIFNFFSSNPLTYPHFVIIFSVGILASLIDSILGSFFQGKYLTIHNQLTEQKKNNQLVTGYSWMSNDLVNLSTSILSSLLALFLSL